MSRELKQQAFAIFNEGVAAANPYQAIQQHLKMTENGLLEITINASNQQTRTGHWKKIHLLAIGKAACAMAEAAQNIIPAELLAESGLAVTNHENVATVNHFKVISASHPLPDSAGFKAAKTVAQILTTAQSGELILALISGGASALLPYPKEPLTLQEKIATTSLLLASGATIQEINCVRKHLSALKGGQFAKLAKPAEVQALILSDVIDNDLSAIASGPTSPDPTTFQDALRICRDRGFYDQLSTHVKTVLEKGSIGQIPETPKPSDKLFDGVVNTLIGSNRVSLNATVAAAKKAGYEAHIFSDMLCGEAREEANRFLHFAIPLAKASNGKKIAILAGGETTVTLKGGGQGGRNQEIALAFSIASQTNHLAGNWIFLSAGTDGRDGPTDAAGGIVDPGSYNRITQNCENPAKMLDNNDSYSALESSGDLLLTGATGTNVADLQVLLIIPSKK